MRVEPGEHLVSRRPELPPDYRLRRPWGHGRCRVLKLLELEEYALGQDVRAGRQELAELYEGRTEVVEATPQPDAKVRCQELLEPPLLAPLPPDVEDEPEPVTDEDAPDLGETPQVP